MIEHTIYKEFIDKISELSDGIYPIITDLDNDLSYVPDKTADFFGFEAGKHTCFFEQLSSCVNDVDLPEYKQEIRYRLNGEKPDDIFYVRMGKHTKEYMMGFYSDIFTGDDGHRYHVLVLRNENTLPDIDPYTYLYGQSKFERDINGYIMENRSVAIIEVEIGHIDEFNILYGSNFNTAIQRELALKFIYMMDGSTATYYMNNCKFVFVVKEADRALAEAFYQKIADTIKSMYFFKCFKFEFDIYAACLILKDYDGDTSTVISKVEYTLDRAKELHSPDLLFFNDMVRFNGSSHIDIMKIIHQSVINGCDGFFVEFQPIVKACNGEIMGAEALVRWKKEPFGTVPPGLFIDWLEDTPAMYELGNYIMRTAISAASEFAKIKPGFFINVNASSEQLEKECFVEDTLAILKEYDFPPSQLWIEITERCRDLPISMIKKTVTAFREAGIHITMDDYGTGSSSSQMMLELPVEGIKIDMFFVKDILEEKKKQALVIGMINFANAADLKICIEGIENDSLESYLRQFDVTCFQGYHYSKPICQDELMKLLIKP